MERPVPELVYGPTEDPRRVLETGLAAIGDSAAAEAIVSRELVQDFLGLYATAEAVRLDPTIFDSNEIYSQINEFYRYNLEELKELKIGNLVRSIDQRFLVHAGKKMMKAAGYIDNQNRGLMEQK